MVYDKLLEPQQPFRITVYSLQHLVWHLIATVPKNLSFFVNWVETAINYQHFAQGVIFFLEHVLGGLFLRQFWNEWSSPALL